MKYNHYKYLSMSIILAETWHARNLSSSGSHKKPVVSLSSFGSHKKPVVSLSSSTKCLFANHKYFNVKPMYSVRICYKKNWVWFALVLKWESTHPLEHLYQCHLLQQLSVYTLFIFGWLMRKRLSLPAWCHLFSDSLVCMQFLSQHSVNDFPCNKSQSLLLGGYNVVFSP